MKTSEKPQKSAEGPPVSRVRVWCVAIITQTSVSQQQEYRNLHFFLITTLQSQSSSANIEMEILRQYRMPLYIYMNWIVRPGNGFPAQICLICPQSRPNGDSFVVMAQPLRNTDVDDSSMTRMEVFFFFNKAGPSIKSHVFITCIFSSLITVICALWQSGFQFNLCLFLLYLLGIPGKRRWENTTWENTPSLQAENSEYLCFGPVFNETKIFFPSFFFFFLHKT